MNATRPKALAIRTILLTFAPETYERIRNTGIVRPILVAGQNAGREIIFRPNAVKKHCIGPFSMSVTGKTVSVIVFSKSVIENSITVTDSDTQIFTANRSLHGARKAVTHDIYILLRNFI